MDVALEGCLAGFVVGFDSAAGQHDAEAYDRDEVDVAGGR